MADLKNIFFPGVEDGKTQNFCRSIPNNSNPHNPDPVYFSSLSNYHRKLSSNYLSDQSPHDLPGSKYTDSDLQKLITENIKSQRRYVQSQSTYLENLFSNENMDKDLGDMKHLEIEYRTMQKEFKPTFKLMKLTENVKEFIGYVKESRRVFHLKKKLLESQLLGLKKPSAEEKSRLGNSFSGVS